MKKLMVLNLVAVLLISVVSCNNPNAEKSGSPLKGANNTELSICQQAGIINIKDPMASMVGYRKLGDDFFEISLDDVGKYSGHVCAGITSGFLMTKQALKMLYQDGDVPVRGNIRVVASVAADQLDVASYITGARAHYGRDEVNANDLIIDPKLQGEKGTFTLVFKRKDNGKMVKAVFNKNKLFGAETLKIMVPLKEKIENATANEQEKKLFAENVQSIVARLINDPPKGAIIMSECTDYNFPNY